MAGPNGKTNPIGQMPTRLCQQVLRVLTNNPRTTAAAVTAAVFLTGFVSGIKRPQENASYSEPLSQG